MNYSLVIVNLTDLLNIIPCNSEQINIVTFEDSVLLIKEHITFDALYEK